MKLQTKLAALATAAVATTAFGNAAQAEDFKLCTGTPGKNYEFAGQQIQAQAKGLGINVQVINTGGSWENLEKMGRGECDGALVQEDNVIAYQRKANLPLVPLANMYQEYVHFICGKDEGVEDVTDLLNTEKTLNVGAAGSGARVTWENIVAADKRYGKVVPQSYVDGLEYTMIDQGIVDCAIFLSGLKSGSALTADATYGKTTLLTEFTDSDLFGSQKGMGGSQLYTPAEIPEGTYPNWTPSAMFSDNAVPTTAVWTKLVVRTDVAGSVQTGLLRASNAAKPNILLRVAPQ